MSITYQPEQSAVVTQTEAAAKILVNKLIDIKNIRTHIQWLTDSYLAGELPDLDKVQAEHARLADNLEKLKAEARLIFESMMEAY